MMEIVYILFFVIYSLITFTFIFGCTWEYIDLRIHKSKPVNHKTLDWFMSAWERIVNLFHRTKTDASNTHVLTQWELPELIKKGAIRIILGWILILPTILGGFFLLDSFLTNNKQNSIPKLILKLEDDNRWEAINKLADYGAVEPMVTAFHSTSNTFLQSGILEAISQIDYGGATEALIVVLNDENPALRTAAAEALAQIVLMAVDERVLIVEPLIAALNDQTPAVRENAALGLGRIGDIRAVEPLIALLNDFDTPVRINAAQALVRIGDKRAETPLMALFERNDLAIIAEESGFFIERAKEGTEPIFIAALNSFGDIESANYFLNCGNLELESAAREWAKQHGYEIGKTSDTSDIVKWGGN